MILPSANWKLRVSTTLARSRSAISCGMVESDAPVSSVQRTGTVSLSVPFSMIVLPCRWIGTVHVED